MLSCLFLAFPISKGNSLRTYSLLRPTICVGNSIASRLIYLFMSICKKVLSSHLPHDSCCFTSPNNRCPFYLTEPNNIYFRFLAGQIIIEYAWKLDEFQYWSLRNSRKISGNQTKSCFATIRECLLPSVFQPSTRRDIAFGSSDD